MYFCDAHIHIAELPSWQPVVDAATESAVSVCACAHSPEDFILLESLKKQYGSSIVASFGVHPQNPDLSLLPFLIDLLQENRIQAIGETGFDLFTKDFAVLLPQQQQAWRHSLDLAISFNKPLVVHCRHALQHVFADIRLLKMLPAVVFHSWPGSPVEALSFLNRGVNAWFSIGKPVLNGNKRAIASAKELPLDRLLLETDAPYQRLKDEAYTKSEDIIKVYNQVFDLRYGLDNGLALQEKESFSEQIYSNFKRAFLIN